MILKPLGDKRSSTGTLEVPSGILGAVLISTDSTNAGVVKAQADNSDGVVVFDVSSKSPIWVAGPIAIGSQALYYDVSGTGASAQFFEWVE